MRLRAFSAGLGVASLLLASVGCTAPPPAPPPERDTTQENLAAINALVGEFVAAYNTADAAALAELFSMDGIRMPPDAPAFSGRDQIQRAFEETFAQARTIVVNLEETVMGDDLAFTRGTWAITTESTGGGDPTSVVGKWINLVQRQPDGSWKISRNIWNRDAPLDDD